MTGTRDRHEGSDLVVLHREVDRGGIVDTLASSELFPPYVAHHALAFDVGNRTDLAAQFPGIRLDTSLEHAVHKRKVEFLAGRRNSALSSPLPESRGLVPRAMRRDRSTPRGHRFEPPDRPREPFPAAVRRRHHPAHPTIFAMVRDTTHDRLASSLPGDGGRVRAPPRPEDSLPRRGAPRGGVRRLPAPVGSRAGPRIEASGHPALTKKSACARRSVMDDPGQSVPADLVSCNLAESWWAMTDLNCQPTD